MNQIKCPHCGKELTIDESNYASIVKQIRDHEFLADLENRENALKEKHEVEIEFLKENLTIYNHILIGLYTCKELRNMMKFGQKTNEFYAIYY